MKNKSDQLKKRSYEIAREIAEASDTPIGYFFKPSETDKLKNKAGDYFNTYKN